MGLAHTKPGGNQNGRNYEASNQKARGTQGRAFWANIQTGLFSPESTGAFFVRDFAGQKIYGDEHLREIEGALRYELA